MTANPLSSELVGTTFEPVSVTWTHNETILYALGLGCGPENDLEFVYEGRGPLVLPTFAVIPAMGSMGGLVTEVDVDPMMILHGEQRVELHRPIPPSATMTATATISAVWDKEKAAVLEVVTTVEDDDGSAFTTTAGVFVQGAGGFGGERGPSTGGRNAPPGRAPDHTVRTTTRGDQAALYRLSGDPNPLHIDPDVAKMAGFERPFLHGLCTYGIVGRAVLATLCADDPGRFRHLEGRFADQVYPGDEIVTKIWDEADGSAIVQAETGDGRIVLSQAAASYSS